MTGNETIDCYDRNAEEIARRYEKIDFGDTQFRLLRVFTGRSTLLELGCGSGRDAAFLVAGGLNLVALDGSPAMLARAEAIHPELKGRLRHAVLPGRLPFADGEFDGVYSLAMLMHLEKGDLSTVFDEIARVLVNGGLLFFSVSLERGDTDREGFDSKGRRFTSLTAPEWHELCVASRFQRLEFSTSEDATGRKGFKWGNFLYRSDGHR